MYDWHDITPDEREKRLLRRKSEGWSWHGPPHPIVAEGWYHLSAACYYHEPIIGAQKGRMADFALKLRAALQQGEVENPVAAWCVLPNHYHALAHAKNVKLVAASLAKLHGSVSFVWNGEDNTRGRKNWHSVMDRAMRSEDHYWAVMNYIHHNPVKHGYVKRWQDWPHSSVHDFMKKYPREVVEALWRQYPVLEMGKGWDD